jgi:hypothetical protein
VRKIRGIVPREHRRVLEVHDPGRAVEERVLGAVNEVARRRVDIADVRDAGGGQTAERHGLDLPNRAIPPRNALRDIGFDAARRAIVGDAENLYPTRNRVKLFLVERVRQRSGVEVHLHAATDDRGTLRLARRAIP